MSKTLTLSQDTLNKINSSLTELVKIFKINSGDIKLTMSQTNCSYEEANEALIKNNGEIVDAILYLNESKPSVELQKKLTSKLFDLFLWNTDNSFNDRLKELIDQGVNVNIQTNKGKTPLHLARTNDQIKLLLEAGADPNIKDNHNNTILHYLNSVGSRIKLIKVVLEYGKFNINSQNSKGETILHLSRTGEETKLLLDAGANPNIQDNNGNTPLHYGLTTYQIKLLLEAGGNVTIKNNEGKIPLQKAKTTEILKLLIEAGSDINHQDTNGNTILFLALPESIKLIIDSGADVTIKNKEGDTVLEYYKRYKPKIAEEILEEYL